jgi:DNA-binding NarL/FixJ family response regulator
VPAAGFAASGSVVELAPPAVQARGAGRVLAVDDQPDLLDGLKMLLEMEGITLIVHDSMITLPLIIRDADPDVILLDLSLPALQGDAAMRLLRSNRLKTDAVLLLFSGRGSQELATLAESLGADGFIAKSDDAVDMVRALENWINHHRVLRAAARGGSDVATRSASSSAR